MRRQRLANWAASSCAGKPAREARNKQSYVMNQGLGLAGCGLLKDLSVALVDLDLLRCSHFYINHVCNIRLDTLQYGMAGVAFNTAMPKTSLAPTLIGATTPVFALTLIAFITRIIVRFRKKKLGIDDGFLMASVVSNIFSPTV
jgi:hypothetical protein